MVESDTSKTSSHGVSGTPLASDPPVSDPLVSDALRLFQKQPEVRWNVPRIARKLGTSRAVLNRRFARALDRSPLAVLRQVRMERAAHLLTESEHGLAHVADAVGYDSEFAFSRAFYRHYGVRPGQFRRSAQQIDASRTRCAA